MLRSRNNFLITSRMSGDELKMAINWASSEGWNPGLHDAQLFGAVDPNGFFIAKINDTPIAVISAVRYGQSFGFIGLYIVNPEHRGKGFGIQIWEVGMRYLEGRSIGLDGVIAQQDNYRKSGFTLHHRNIRYKGLTQAGVCTSKDHEHTSIKDLALLPFGAIKAFDRSFFPSDRSDFLSSWIRQPSGHSLGLIENGELVGYGLIRPCIAGFKIGPLYANTDSGAEKLFNSLCAKVPENSLFSLDVPEPNLGALALAHRHGMKPIFETARMYKGVPWGVRLENTYGITTLELG